MVLYLLKSGACLAIFYGFYKWFLEKESIHTFKRYYLLVSLLLAFIIPLITFTKYIEIAPQEAPVFYSDIPLTHAIIEDKPTHYIPIILWTIYSIGVLLLALQFIKNLLQLLSKIKCNTKVKINRFTNVLLQDLIVPHTFFNYIFLNKQQFETHQIPQEVLLHEETHAKQKHSMDVLFIEILNILFWFNPLIYFIKHSMKLNHEFLADQAVLNQGIPSSHYQNILLAFSSNATEPPLANAIHYSSIKKRFTVMKTHTSKQAFWLRNLILLPLLAILIYSFSQRKVIEKDTQIQKQESTNTDIKVVISKDKKVLVENQLVDFELLSKKLVEITMKEAIKPAVYIEIEGRPSMEYLENITNEVKKSKLNISTIRATSLYFDESDARYKRIKKNFKSMSYTADTMLLKSERGTYMTGISGPNPPSSNSKYQPASQNQMTTKPNTTEALHTTGFNTTNISFFNINKAGQLWVNIEQNQLIETPQNYDKNIISIAINKTGKLLVNQDLIEINDLKNFLEDFTKDLTSEDKENLVIKLISNDAPSAIMDQVKAILRASNLLKIITFETLQKATPEEMEQYNTIVKKFNAQPAKKRHMPQPEFQVLKSIYDKMSLEQRAQSEALPKLVPPPAPPAPSAWSLPTNGKLKDKP